MSKIEHHKRQHVVLEAMKHVKTPVRLRIVGYCRDHDYFQALRHVISEHGLSDRVMVDNRWISDEEKTSLLSEALAVAHIPFDGDSYGYPTVEAALSSKCTVTTFDSGSVLEFVCDNVCGLVTAPDPRALAEAFDRLWTDRGLAATLGRNARQRIIDMKFSWHRVLQRLTT